MGTRPCRIEAQRAAARATATPSTTPMISPPTASTRVRSPAPQMTEKFSTKAVAISLGLASTKLCTSNSRSRPSQAASTATKATAAGR